MMSRRSFSQALVAAALLVTATCGTGFKALPVKIAPKLNLRARRAPTSSFAPWQPNLDAALRTRGGFSAPTMSASAVALFTEKVAPTLGTAIANSMFLSTLPAVRAARRNNDLGELNAVPFAMMVANCVAWLGYSFVTRNPYVFWSNAPGLLLGLFYTMTGVRLATPAAKRSLETLLLGAFVINVASGYASSMMLTDPASRQLLAGVVANGILVIYYASPLSTLAKVIKERSSASLYWPLSMLNTLNGLLWTVYGLAVADVFIYAPNAVGAALGFIQLLFCGLFPNKQA